MGSASRPAQSTLEKTGCTEAARLKRLPTSRSSLPHLSSENAHQTRSLVLDPRTNQPLVCVPLLCRHYLSPSHLKESEALIWWYPSLLSCLAVMSKSSHFCRSNVHGNGFRRFACGVYSLARVDSCSPKLLKTPINSASNGECT